MKIKDCVILAGGYGTRLSEYTNLIPKPMITIGNKPLICHIIDYYISFGVENFYVALGYKGNVITDYFKNNKKYSKFNINLIKTGLKTLTGGRVRKLEPYLKNDFFLTYGDGLSNVDLEKLTKHHFKYKKYLTMTVVHPPARFGEVELEKNLITKFEEKPQLQKGWINGGFFVASPKIFKYLKNDFEMLERQPIKRLLIKKQLSGFKHKKFWFCVDTKREKDLLEKIWKSKKIPWHIKFNEKRN